MNPADNAPDGNPAPAAGNELSIPKQRFDEVSAEVRRLREEMAIKDQLYLRDRQQTMAAQQQQPRGPTLPTADELGLDPQIHQAVTKIAAAMVTGIVQREKVNFDQQIGALAERTEKAELISMKGQSAAKSYAEIQRMQTEHYQRTGGFLSAEIAFEMIQGREKDGEIERLRAQLAAATQGKPAAQPAPAQAPAYQPPSGGVPNAAATRAQPNPAAAEAPAPSSFSEMTVEQMEAQLAEGFKSGLTA